MPCGKCDVGTYNEVAMLNPTAIAFLSMNESDRFKGIPKCKRRDRLCRGYLDLHKLKITIDNMAKEGE